jgi:hypothetical protein
MLKFQHGLFYCPTNCVTFGQLNIEDDKDIQNAGHAADGVGQRI